VPIPTSVYRAERRDLTRHAASGDHVSVNNGSGSGWFSVDVADETQHGIGIQLPHTLAEALPGEVQLRRSSASTELLFGRVRHRTLDTSRPGWARIGLSVSGVPTGRLLSVDRREQILGRPQTVREKVKLARDSISAIALRAGFTRPREHNVNVVEYEYEQGKHLSAIEDGWGPPSGCVGVIIPPAWGRTKETMLPLALTVVETFRAIGEPIRVVRFDGSNRRGESHIHPDCRRPGDEYLRFTFSGAARDISSIVRYMNTDPVRMP
jgi:hypothetical protein